VIFGQPLHCTEAVASYCLSKSPLRGVHSLPGLAIVPRFRGDKLSSLADRQTQLEEEEKDKEVS